MTEIYVIATTSGKRPSLPQKTESLAKRALAVCRTGWPEEEWTVYTLQYENMGKHINGIISLASLPESETKHTLFRELQNRSYLHDIVL